MSKKAVVLVAVLIFFTPILICPETHQEKKIRKLLYELVKTGSGQLTSGAVGSMCKSLNLGSFQQGKETLIKNIEHHTNKLESKLATEKGFMERVFFPWGFFLGGLGLGVGTMVGDGIIGRYIKKYCADNEVSKTGLYLWCGYAVERAIGLILIGKSYKLERKRLENIVCLKNSLECNWAVLLKLHSL